jgi:FdhD protein
MGTRPGSRTRLRVRSIDDGRDQVRSDFVATEEPLEIRLASGGSAQTVAVTMRTPGSDFELAAGFLLAEGVISDRNAIAQIRYCVDPDVEADQQFNIVTVDLRPGINPDLVPLERHFHITSACGVCGKASLEALQIRGCSRPPPGPTVDADVLVELPEKLRRAQGVFESTGGLHAAALFTARGELLAAREDVGRHNAVDKLMGWALVQDMLPLNDHVLLVSGRSSYEIMQKALSAGVPIVCAVSAPSSLAVALGQEFGLTLIGFLRGQRYNVYSGGERLAQEPAREGSARRS